jgi:hypothetical protein
MEIFIDFGGFYESIHSYRIGDRIEMDLDWHPDFQCDEIGSVNWRETFIDYSKEYVYRLNQELDLNLSFVDLHSPKYYNYTTDKIIAKVNEEDKKTLSRYIYDSDFLEWANPRLTSRSGFHSFYNGVKGLLEMAQHYEKDQEVLIGLVIDWLITKEEINDNIFDLEIEIIYNELQN